MPKNEKYDIPLKIHHFFTEKKNKIVPKLIKNIGNYEMEFQIIANKLTLILPIGRGQRQLIIGDRFTGKTTV